MTSLRGAAGTLIDRVSANAIVLFYRLSASLLIPGEQEDRADSVGLICPSRVSLLLWQTRRQRTEETPGRFKVIREMEHEMDRL